MCGEKEYFMRLDIYEEKHGKPPKHKIVPWQRQYDLLRLMFAIRIRDLDIYHLGHLGIGIGFASSTLPCRINIDETAFDLTRPCF